MTAGIHRAFNIARTGLEVQESMMAVKAQNLAAQSADSFKKQYVVATDLPYIDESGVGSTISSLGNNLNPTGTQIGLGVRNAGIYRSFTQGDLSQTGEAFDVAIQGNGYYQITLPDGTAAYTRLSTFQKGPDGTLQTITGYPLSPKITVPINAVSLKVSEDGQVMVEIEGQVGYQTLGQIQLVTFINPNGLKCLGDTMFVETTASGTPNIGQPGTLQFGTLRQGYREQSNVNSIEEITDLIAIQRIYETLTRVLSTGDQMMDATNRIGR